MTPERQAEMARQMDEIELSITFSRLLGEPFGFVEEESTDE